MTPFVISPPLLDQIHAHALRAFPAECCGYVLDDAVVECSNAETDQPDRGFVIDGKEYRAEPANFFTSQSAFHEVTLSLKGRFGGTTRVYANDDPEDWLHSMRTHIPKGDRSAQLRMVLSVRREALLGLIR